jgi:hypothetical protein
MERIDLPGHVFRGFVTNRNDAALEIWGDYNAKPFHFARKINSGHGARRRICSASQPKANRVSQL